MVDLKKIRDEYAKRPIEGVAPAEIEKKFPKTEDFWASPEICIIEGCHRDTFRGLRYCQQHHLERCRQRESDAEKRAEEFYRRRNKKDYPEIEAQNMVKNKPHCENCGNYTVFADRRVRLKPKSRLPKAPASLVYRYEMLCCNCAGK